MTTCPVCGSPGADAHSIGTNVTVFCCSACLDGVRHTFALHARPTNRHPLTPRPDDRFPIAV